MSSPPSSGKRLALYKPDRRGRYVKTQRALFWDEGSLTAQLFAWKSSRHAQRIFGADVPSRTLLLEYVKGKSIGYASPAFLRRNKTRIIRELASALAEHSLVHHWDLNTGNIVLSTQRGKGRTVRPLKLKFIDYEKATTRDYPFDVDTWGKVTNFDYSQIKSVIIPEMCSRIGGKAAAPWNVEKLQGMFEREFVRKMVKRTPGADPRNVTTMRDYLDYAIRHLPSEKPDSARLVKGYLESLKRGFEEYSRKHAPEREIEPAKLMGKTGAERLKERIRRSRWKNAMIAWGQ